MRIYTRTGDDGTTGLVGGRRVRKSEERIEAIGDVDELNAALGWVRRSSTDPRLADDLSRIQNWLFDLGAELASPDEGRHAIRRIGESAILSLEASIDGMESNLAPLQNFILPGGSETASRLHLARTVCRRAERSVQFLREKASLRDVIPQFLNRLSDWLFVAARNANHAEGVKDIEWKSEEV